MEKIAPLPRPMNLTGLQVALQDVVQIGLPLVLQHVLQMVLQ